MSVQRPEETEGSAIPIDALRAGDPAAVGALFDAYADRVYRLALSLLRDPAAAEDIVQETFLSAVMHLDRFEGRSSLGTWLYRVAYNASIDRLRRHQEEPLPPDEPEVNPDTGAAIPLPEAIVDWAASPERWQADHEVSEEVHRAIAELPPGLRIVVLLRDVEGLSTKETAEALGLSEGATKVRLHRARMALRERLSAYFAERMPREGGAP
jgi:RNA polymerase sigma-70 factor (ECF subfamily)